MPIQTKWPGRAAQCPLSSTVISAILRPPLWPPRRSPCPSRLRSGPRRPALRHENLQPTAPRSTGCLSGTGLWGAEAKRCQVWRRRWFGDAGFSRPPRPCPMRLVGAGEGWLRGPAARRLWGITGHARPWPTNATGSTQPRVNRGSDVTENRGGSGRSRRSCDRMRALSACHAIHPFPDDRTLVCRLFGPWACVSPCANQEHTCMKTIGLIGGMSWESTALYYHHLNRLVRDRLGGLHSAQLMLWSFDFAAIAARQQAGDWDGRASARRRGTPAGAGRRRGPGDLRQYDASGGARGADGRCHPASAYRRCDRPGHPTDTVTLTRPARDPLHQRTGFL